MPAATATAILGSGTATTLIVAGIAASGAIGTSLGLAVLLGADVGSAVVSSLFASGSSLAVWASPILIFAGYVIFSVTREFRPHNVGRIMIGLGLMLMSLKLISVATAPLREASLFHAVLTAIGQEPLLAFLTGAILAWAFHSTLAVILLIASFVANGSLELGGALAFILGLNLGGGLPAISSTLGLAAGGAAASVANLMCRSISGPDRRWRFIQRIAGWARFLPVDRRRRGARPFTPHSIWRSACSSCRSPNWLKNRSSSLCPTRSSMRTSLAAPRYLDVKHLDSPSIALSPMRFSKPCG